jgi:hypothetical protein
MSIAFGLHAGDCRLGSLTLLFCNTASNEPNQRFVRRRRGFGRFFIALHYRTFAQCVKYPCFRNSKSQQCQRDLRSGATSPTLPPASQSPNKRRRGTPARVAHDGPGRFLRTVNTREAAAAPSPCLAHGRQHTVAPVNRVRLRHNTRKVSTREFSLGRPSR